VGGDIGAPTVKVNTHRLRVGKGGWGMLGTEAEIFAMPKKK
jgi:hypothetical protein